jgi:hypothetical protein
MPRTPKKQPTDDPAGPILHTNLTIIEVTEPELLDELQADRRLGPMLVAQLSDRFAVVRPEDRDRFLQQLLRAGHTPKVKNV